MQPIRFYEAILREIEILQKQIKRYQKSLSKFVEGSILCETRGNGYRYVYSRKSGKNRLRTILHESDHDLIATLIRKYQIQQKLWELERDLNAAKAYRDTFESCQQTQRGNQDGFSLLLNKVFPPTDYEEWGNAPYSDSRDYHPEQLKHRTGKGDERVRSKSEVLIARALQAHGIQYHYEEVTQIGYRTYRPDFTIRHPKTGAIIIWEHFGMMDDPHYAKRTAEKVRNYLYNGYNPTQNFIATFEDKNHPLDISVIEDMIERMLLNEPELIEQ